MHAQRLVLRHDLGLYPGISRFALDLVKRRGAAEGFLSRSRSIRPEPLSATPSRELVARELAEMNGAWGNDVAGELDLWRRGGVITLVAGQQTGFGGGPLYTLAKLASLIRLRDEFRAAGRDAVAFFWLATEDHDYVEAATLTLPSSDGVRTLRALERPEPGHVVGTLPLPASLVDQLRRHDPLLAGEWSNPGLTFRDSFARLVSDALTGRGVVLVDALLPAMRRAGSSLFGRIVGRWNELQKAFDERDLALRAAGYSPQVQTEQDHALLWRIDGAGVRRPIRRGAGGAFRVGESETDSDEMLRIVHEDAERISTGALVRPLLQDLVFGTDCFLGGPAEVSYYAQSEVAHGLLEVRPPAVMLRGHALVAPARIVEKFAGHGFEAEELYDEATDALSRRESGAVEEWTSTLQTANRRLSQEIEEALPLASENAPEMKRSIARSMRRIEYHIERMRDRGVRAIGRRDLERARAFDRAQRVLAPGRVPQDRIVAWLPLWMRWRGDLVDALVESTEPHTDTVAVIGLEG